MEITRQKSGDILAIKLVGRLDANWCNHVQKALAAAVRDGEHRIHLDLAGVTYISSAGLRVLLSFFKEIRAIGGTFGIVHASSEAHNILELAGLEMLIATAQKAQHAAAEEGTIHATANARYEIFPAATAGSVRLAATGEAAALRGSVQVTGTQPARFGADTLALGVGALGVSYPDCAARFGEFLAVAGVAAFQPSDGSSRPDFIVSQEALVPEGFLHVGLTGTGVLSTLVRFEATPETRTVGLTEVAGMALETSGAAAAAVVILAETACLVGAALRKSPVKAGGADRFAFPEIREWLSFTSERAFRDSTSLLVGVVARAGTPFAPLLRPLGRESGLQAHVHAAAFPYRPLRKGRIELQPSVTELFDSHALQGVLHLLADPREFNGAGESEFFRGALWVAPVQT